MQPIYDIELRGRYINKILLFNRGIKTNSKTVILLKKLSQIIQIGLLNNIYNTYINQ